MIARAHARPQRRASTIDADVGGAVDRHADDDGPGPATHGAVLDEDLLAWLGGVDVGVDLTGFTAVGTGHAGFEIIPRIQNLTSWGVSL